MLIKWRPLYTFGIKWLLAAHNIESRNCSFWPFTLHWFRKFRIHWKFCHAVYPSKLASYGLSFCRWFPIFRFFMQKICFGESFGSKISIFADLALFSGKFDSAATSDLTGAWLEKEQSSRDEYPAAAKIYLLYLRWSTVEHGIMKERNLSTVTLVIRFLLQNQIWKTTLHPLHENTKTYKS